MPACMLDDEMTNPLEPLTRMQRDLTTLAVKKVTSASCIRLHHHSRMLPLFLSCRARREQKRLGRDSDRRPVHLIIVLEPDFTHCCSGPLGRCSSPFMLATSKQVKCHPCHLQYYTAYTA